MPDKSVDVQARFDVRGRTAVITGGSGYLGRAMAEALAQAGAQVAILARHGETAQTVAQTIESEGGRAIGIAADVLDRAALEQSREQIRSAFGPVDILINAAGGNFPAATTSDQQSFFELGKEAVNHVLDLNFTGTFQSCQVFGRDMAERGVGCIINITSMSGV